MWWLTDTGDPIVTTMAIGWHTCHGENGKKTMINQEAWTYCIVNKTLQPFFIKIINTYLNKITIRCMSIVNNIPLHELKV